MVDCRRHMGYLNVQEAATFVLGVPAGLQTQFMIEGAFQRILPAAETMVQKYLDALNGIEAQFLDDQGNIAVESIGDIKVNLKEFEGLVKQYKHWQGNLANLLGVPPNPFDMRPMFGAAGGGGVNVPVNHG